MDICYMERNTLQSNKTVAYNLHEHVYASDYSYPGDNGNYIIV